MKKYLPAIVFFSILLIFAYLIVHFIQASRDLKNGNLINGVFVAKISSALGSTNAYFECKLPFNNKENTITTMTPIKYRNGSILVGHYFPALYSEKYNRLKLLLLPKDFKKRGLSYPDSLKWVDSLFREE